jgi:hypothetical protein
MDKGGKWVLTAEANNGDLTTANISARSKETDIVSLLSNDSWSQPYNCCVELERTHRGLVAMKPERWSVKELLRPTS